MLEQITSWITNSISTTGYLAVFFLMIAESALIPIPSEVTMPFAGFLVSLGKLNFFLAVLVGAVGNLLGSLLAYALGYFGQETVVKQVIKKYGKWILVSEEEFEKAEIWFQRHGGKIAFFSRLMPVVRTYISLPAGISRMNVLSFSVFTFLGSLIWSSFLAYLGVILGQNWQALEIYFRRFDILIIAGVLVLGLLFLYHKIKKQA